MRRAILLILLFIVFSPYLKAENVPCIITNNGKKIDAAQILNSNTSGTDFIIALPANELRSSANDNSEYQEIYLTSPFNTTVRYKSNINGSGGLGTPINVEAYNISKISLDQSNEIREFEKPINKTFTLTSPKRFSVYVINRKITTSDGYLALPTSAWGTQYFHLCNYDNPEGDGEDGYSKGSGFVVIAQSDNTHITIKLRDQANIGDIPPFGLGRTTGYPIGTNQHKGGDTINITLRKNQAYAIQGNGKSEGFDLSGSEISSDLPIGLISYHNRTDLPVSINSSRNHLVEMLPPVSAWGNIYVTVEFNRKACGAKGWGDLIRVVASDDNTNVNMRWYDKSDTNKSLIKSINKNLQKGEVFEYNQTQQTNAFPQKGCQGTTIVEANKPILANQYSYSYDWDGNGNGYFDPFMITLTPVEQFVPLTVFQAPHGFIPSFFNFIVMGYTPEDALKPVFAGKSPEEINTMKLSSLYFGINDSNMENIPDTLILKNRIPSTGGTINAQGDSIGGLYWHTIQTADGAYRFESQDFLTKFGGYIYGYDAADGYGWPAAGAARDVNEIDTLPPLKMMANHTDNKTWSFRYVDSVNLKQGSQKGQKDMGLSGIYLAYNKNKADDKPFTDNFILLDSNGAELNAICANDKDYTFNLKVIDDSKPARALIKVIDQNFNVSTETISYTPELSVEQESANSLLTISPNPASDVVKIKVNFESLKSYDLAIYNEIGEKVKEISNSQNLNTREIEFKTDELSSGIYFIKLISGDLSITKQLVIKK